MSIRSCVTSGGLSLFLSDDSKHDVATTDEHSKLIIYLLKIRTLFSSDISTIWKNIDGCAKQYRCATALYLLSMLAHAYNITIYHVVGASGHGREVVGSLDFTGKIFLSNLMTTVQLPGAEACESQMEMHTSNANTDISLVRGFLKHLSDPTRSQAM